MPAAKRPYVPDSMPIAQALAQHGSLGQLQARIRQSNVRFDAIRGALPGALAASIKPGPVDDSGWTLLAANAAVAAKLRQLQPRLEAIMKEHGWVPADIRIKVLQQS